MVMLHGLRKCATRSEPLATKGCWLPTDALRWPRAASSGPMSGAWACAGGW